MKRFPIFFALLFGGMLLMGADGCSSDPNVEGAKLDLRNKDYDRALENLNTALEKNPQNAEAYELKGRVLQERAFETQDVSEHSAMLAEMLDAYQQASELDPELAPNIQNYLALAYVNEFQRGIEAFNRGNNSEDRAEFSAAATYFGNSAEIAPDSAGAYANQAYAYINAGARNDAIGPLEMAIEKGDTQPDTYIILADLYRTTEQTDKALEVLQAANEMYPENNDLAAQLLNAYVMSGQIDRAMEAYEEQVAADPDNKLYRYNYGSLLLEAQDYEGAIEQLSRAVELDPTYASAQYNLGAAYVNMAVDINERIGAMDDDLRANRGSMSQADITARESEMEALAEQRKELFAQAITPLEQARSLMEAADEDPTAVCQALFSAYVQTDQQEKAEALSECTGYDLN